jgi:acyl dehydratase
VQQWFFEDIPEHQPRTTSAYVVPEDELTAFARKWDPLPIHTDREAAKMSLHGGLIAPATYIVAVANSAIGQLDPKIAAIGGADWKVKFTAPVRAGDRLVATFECVHKRESRTKPDRGIARFVCTVHNQEGKTVLVWESNVLVSKRDALAADGA